jgi:hypothetical protein
MIADDYDFGQGYLFAKVLFQTDFLKLLKMGKFDLSQK